MSESSLWETVAKSGIGHGLEKEAELQKRITELEEALRPFAVMFRERQDDAEDIGYGPGHLLVRGVGSDMTVLRARDLRLAFEALGEETR